MKSRLFLLVVLLAGTASCDIFRHKREDPGPPPLFKAASTELTTTTITAHTLAVLTPDENQVYCATFALAWNTMIDSVIGEPIVLGGPADTEKTQETTAALNQRLFEADYLDPTSYVALAGFVREDIEQRIRNALTQKFGSSAPRVEFHPITDDDVISYAYLLKRLDFEHVFTTIEKPLRFNGDESQKVHAFGVEDDEKGGKAADMLDQVIVKGYTERGPIVEITTKSDRDHLILAMVESGATLQETWERVVAADEEQTDYTLSPGVDFKVPKINFDLEHRFTELIGQFLQNEGWVENDYFVSEALQNIRFQLTERGAVLESSATFSIAPTGGSPPRFVFDRPFLLVLIEEGAEQPYFLLWIADAELLARVK